MPKVAKLVWVTVGTRVIVDDTDDDLAIMDAARNGLCANIRSAGTDLIDEIVADTQMPYGTGTGDYEK